jgi:hypothetical protein
LKGAAMAEPAALQAEAAIGTTVGNA